MSQPMADRNLLFGMLALQMDFIRREQLIAAMQEWVFDKSKPLGQILVEQKILGQDNRALLEALVEKHLALHEDDTEKSLAAVGAAASVRKELENLTDDELKTSLGRVKLMSSPDDSSQQSMPSLVPAGTGSMRFRILRPHAKGGLGEVWIAQDEELHREVALKEIQEPAADDPESRSRFVIEAEITGGLEHPGIVPVYGLGTYADGRPYYAMRFIRGDSLKDAIERFHKADAVGMEPGERALELRGLLGRFVDVCNAIAYAHSRGVLHRDLKPGNIMLGKYGETLVVDWGLAKPMGDTTKEPTHRTEPGEGSLVPHSISMTAQTMMGSAVGTPQYMSPEQAAGRHDQLGPASDVYSLGATLYCLLTGKPPIEDKDVGVVLKKVQSGDIVKPSTVKPELDPALEAICLKAMALNPGDRYESPKTLADDIEHWLADEPVAAWPEPWTTTARRWIGRNATLVTSVASTVAVVLVGLIVTTILLTAANKREREAKETAQRNFELMTIAKDEEAKAKVQMSIARDDEAKAKVVAQKNFEKAEENFQLARSAVDRYHTHVSQEDLLNEPGMQPLRKKLLDSAREFYEKFKKERAGDPAVQGELGKATFRLAQIVGDIDSEIEAIKLLEEAVKLFQALPENKNSAEVQSDLAGSWHHLGRLYRLTDQMAKSDAAYTKALAIWDQLVKVHPKDEAMRDGLARSQLGLGNLHQLARRRDAAREIYLLAKENWDKLHKAHPKATGYRRDLAIALHNTGMIYKSLAGKEAEAEHAFRSAEFLQKQLVEEAPNIGQYQHDLAKTQFNLGEFQDAAKLWQGLIAKHPAVIEGHKILAETQSELARVHLTKNNDRAKAQEAADQAVAIQRKLVASHPGVSRYQGTLGGGLLAQGEVFLADNRLDKAESAFSEAVGIFDKLVADIPEVPHYQRDLARGYTNLGNAHTRNQKDAKAADAYKKAIGLWDQLLKQLGDERDYSEGLMRTCFILGNLTSNGGNSKDAVSWYMRALDAAPRPMKPAIQLPLAMALARSGKHREAVATADGLVGKAEAGASLFQFAKVYALSAGAATLDSQPQLADAYAAQAVKLLSSAFADKTFKTAANLAKLESEPDLQSVRARADYKKLQAQLKTK
ncbi:MAG: protein kinase [Planctomycetes bacterium]|nr:protein kinase [Planctomycetota bacterium]